MLNNAQSNQAYSDEKQDEVRLLQNIQ